MPAKFAKSWRFLLSFGLTLSLLPLTLQHASAQQTPPPPGRKWMPGHWAQADNGWQWVSGFWLAGNRDLQYVPEPPQSVDNGPSVPAPDDNSVYIPGAWQLRDDRYRWRPGFWNQAYDN